MSTAPNFSSILDEAPTEVDRPKPRPVGTYLFTIGGPRYDKSSKKGTEFVEFIGTAVGAEDDVDEEELDIAGGLPFTIKFTYYLTETQKWRLDQFHEHCGIDLSEPESRKSRNDEVAGSQVLAYIKHEPATDGSDQAFMKVGRTLPAD